MDMPGVRMDTGTVEEVLAAIQSQNMSHHYHLNETITDATITSYLAKQDEAQDLVPFLKTVTAPAEKLFTIGVERSGMVSAFQQEITAHPEFMPADISTNTVTAKIDLFKKLRRMKDRRDDENRRLELALQMAGDDLGSIFSAYYGSAQLAAKRELPDASMTVSNLKPFMSPPKTRKTPPATPA
jgi:hypothetical protein